MLVTGCVLRAFLHPTGRRLSRLRNRQRPEERPTLDPEDPGCGQGRQPMMGPWQGGGAACVVCEFAGVSSPPSVCTPSQDSFLRGWGGDFQPSDLRLCGPAGQTEEFKHGLPHFWPVLPFVASAVGGKGSSPGCPGACREESKEGIRAPRPQKGPLRHPSLPAAPFSTPLRRLQPTAPQGG